VSTSSFDAVAFLGALAPNFGSSNLEASVFEVGVSDGKLYSIFLGRNFFTLIFFGAEGVFDAAGFSGFDISILGNPNLGSSFFFSAERGFFGTAGFDAFGMSNFGNSNFGASNFAGGVSDGKLYPTVFFLGWSCFCLLLGCGWLRDVDLGSTQLWRIGDFQRDTRDK